MMIDWTSFTWLPSDGQNLAPIFLWNLRGTSSAPAPPTSTAQDRVRVGMVRGATVDENPNVGGQF